MVRRDASYVTIGKGPYSIVLGYHCQHKVLNLSAPFIVWHYPDTYARQISLLKDYSSTWIRFWWQLNACTRAFVVYFLPALFEIIISI